MKIYLLFGVALPIFDCGFFRRLFGTVFTVSLVNLTMTPSHAFDAGSSDPNLRQTDILLGDKQCMTNAGFLQASKELTMLHLVTDRGESNTEMFSYNGGFYYNLDGYSDEEDDYTRTTSHDGDTVDGELFVDLTDNNVVDKCGWDSATFTDNTPSSNFAAAETSFAAAEEASVTLDYVYNARDFKVTWAIKGEAFAVPTVTSIYTGEPNAPTSLSASAGNGEATISFTAPTDLSTFTQTGEEDNTITNYEYTLDNGTTWVALSPSDATSPVTISGLTNGTTYSVKLRAVNGVGAGLESTAVSVTPTDTTASTFDVAPSVGSVTSSGFTPSASIDEAGKIYYVVVADGATAPSASQVKAGIDYSGVTVLASANATVSSSPFTSSFSAITSLSDNTAYDVYFVAEDDEGTPNLQSSVTKVDTTTLGSPASEFAKEEESIKEDIVKDVQQSLQNAVTANARLVREAKSRFIASRSSVSGYAGSNNVPFDVTGVTNGTAMHLSTNGTFFGQVGSDDGKARRLFFGDFSINGERNGSVTASISGKVAWERQITDMTMYGYFIGGEVNQTDIKTTFTGQQQGYGLNLGAYAVSEVQEDVFLDGFVSVGVGRSELDMSNDVLSLDGNYQTQSVTLGGALTGVYDMETYELWPELAFTVGRTQIGNANFTGRAYGLVDNTLTLDAGDVTVANLTMRPEVRVPISEATDSAKMAQWTFAPRVICERIVTDTAVENCGRGAEVGFVSRSADGMTNVTGRVMRDYVGSSTRTGLELKLQHRF